MSHIGYAIRQLARRPGLSLVVILILALGIGATTAMSSVFYQILVRTLPVTEPERLVNLREPGPKEGRASCSSAGPIGYDYCFSYPMFRDLESEQEVFTDVAAHYAIAVNLIHGDQTQTHPALLVSGGYFSVLNVEPALGRLIGQQDEPRVGESAVAVLSYGYWQSNFGGDPDVLGETLTVNGQALTVIGVGPPGFTGTTLGRRPQIFVPLTLRWRMQPNVSPDTDNRQSYWLHLFARLNPGVTVDQASAAINGLHRGILDKVEAPLNTRISDAQFRERRITLEPGARGETELRAVTRAIEVAWGAEQQLTLLLGITLVVLLIVCINLANLLLARGASRTEEIAIRASIGATRRHLVMQLLTEAGMLAAVGAVLSVPVAAITLRVVTTILPQEVADGLAIGLDPAATLFAVALSLLTVLAFGLVPALSTTRANLGPALRGNASKSAGNRRVVRFRTGLVTAQIAFSMVLLALAGLFAQSLANVLRVDLGIDSESLVSFQTAPGLNGYSQDTVMALYDRLEEELAAQPGVMSVSSASIPVIANSFGLAPVSLEGFEPAPGQNMSTSFNMVGTGFFDTLSIPLLAGRDFTTGDTSDSVRVAVVNQSFVRRFELGDDALGSRFSTLLTGNTAIVGVVADAKSVSVKDESRPQFFVPRRQVDNISGLSFYLRAGIDVEALARMIPRVVASVDPNLPVSKLTTMEQQVRDNVYLDRLITVLSAGFAGIATALASIGLYGVLAYSVTLRRRELGLRLALGATPGHLRAMVLQHVGVMALVGGAIGLAAAVGFGRLAGALLYGLSGYDLGVLSAAAAVLAAVALAAGYIPARRASNIAPMEALRYE